MRQLGSRRRPFGNLTRRNLLRSIGVAPLARPRHLLSASPPRQPRPSPETLERLRKIGPRHPSLHFGHDQIETFRERASGTHQRYSQILTKWVEEHRSWSPPRLNGGTGAEVALEETGAFLTNAALAWVISEDEEVLAVALDWARTVSAQGIEGIRSYGRGALAAGLARSYDWLYSALEDEDRELIRCKLESILSGLSQAAKKESQHAEWWATLPLHHDHWVPVGGLGEASLALLGEVKEAAEWAAWAKADFDLVFSHLDDDGAWHEGVADWVYAMAPLLWFFSAWESVASENPHDVPWLRNTSLYRLYHWLPDNTYIYLNDSFRSGRYNTSGSASCHLLRRLAAIFRDGHTQWLAEQDEMFDLDPQARGVFRAPFEDFSFVQERVEYEERSAHCLAWNLLWHDPQIRPTAPEQTATSRHFENQGIVILRSGWDKNAAVVSLSCGPLAGHRVAEEVREGTHLEQGNSHHAHADYGSFTLFARGQYFVVPPGYARRSSHFQNVVTVNGSDFLTNQDLEVQILGTEPDLTHSYAVADATNAFPSHHGIALYRRHLVLLHEGLLIVFDDLRKTGGRTSTSYDRFEWTVHIDPTIHRLQSAGRKIRWVDPDGVQTSMSMEVLFPENFAWEQTIIQAKGGQPLLSALSLTRPEWYTGEMNLMSVFCWCDQPSEPKPVLHDGVWGVTWAETSTRPAIVFAASTAKASTVRQLVNDKRRILLFGMQSPPDSVRL